MEWIKPNFDEICLSMEVSAYVNSDDEEISPLFDRKSTEKETSEASA